MNHSLKKWETSMMGLVIFFTILLVIFLISVIYLFYIILKYGENPPIEVIIEKTKVNKAKTRRMTHQELSWWLRDCPEEHREYSFCDDKYVRYFHTYRKDSANEEVPEYVRVRKNGGEWQEPFVEI